jgi:hypothetical protein
MTDPLCVACIHLYFWQNNINKCIPLLGLKNIMNISLDYTRLFCVMILYTCKQLIDTWNEILNLNTFSIFFVICQIRWHVPFTLKLLFIYCWQLNFTLKQFLSSNKFCSSPFATLVSTPGLGLVPSGCPALVAWVFWAAPCERFLYLVDIYSRLLKRKKYVYCYKLKDMLKQNLTFKKWKWRHF